VTRRHEEGPSQAEDADDIAVTGEDAVRIVTLNRPGARNAFSERMHRGLTQVLADLDDDPDVRAIVLTGAGDAFSAGGSLDDFEAKRIDFSVRRQSLRVARRLLDDMLNLRCPIVAAVNGPAVGLGCTLVTLCDIVFIAESAFLCDPHVAVALVAGDGAGVTWPHYTSLLKAKQYLLTGDRITPPDAVSLGMANFAVPDSSLMTEAVAFAERLASLPPQAVQDTKAVLNQLLRHSALLTLGQGLAAESQSHDTAEYAAVAARGSRRPADL